MIWYAVDTGEPIAPGAGEDAGPPSIDGFYCPKCEKKRGLVFERYDLNVDQKTIKVIGYGFCFVCGKILLTTG